MNTARSLWTPWPTRLPWRGALFALALASAAPACSGSAADPGGGAELPPVDAIDDATSGTDSGATPHDAASQDATSQDAAQADAGSAAEDSTSAVDGGDQADVPAQPDATTGDASADATADTSTGPKPTTAADLNPGDLVITEILADAKAVSDSVGEWFELYNPTTTAIDLRGLSLVDKDGKLHPISATTPLLLPAKGFATLGINGDTKVNGGVSHLYAYGDAVKLSNDGATIELKGPKGTIDKVSYKSAKDGWPLVAKGKAMHLKGEHWTAKDNDSGTNWCIGAKTFGAGDVGTPGSGAHTCLTDKDKDGIADSDDSCPKTPDSGADSDADGIADACDNCKKTANKDQTDSDGDGVGDACAPGVTLSPGDVIISEIMPNPATIKDSDGEWLELYNTTKAAIDLKGQVLISAAKDGSSAKSMVLSPKTSLMIPAGGYLLVVRHDKPKDNGGLSAGAEFKDMSLGNSGGLIRLKSGSVVVDEVVYPDDGKDGWPTYGGNSLQLSADALNATANDKGKSWCKGDKPYETASKKPNTGTPGKPNKVCK